MTNIRTEPQVERITTGVRNLDAILDGGFPKRSLVVFAGDPGAGKTILSQQIGFHNASPEFKVIYFQTLSEPTAKTLSHAKLFGFFDAAKVGKSVHFVDLGDLSAEGGLDKANELIKENIKRVRPSLVVIDSFKAFEDLSDSRETLRKFSYQAAITVLTWECTCFLLGEYAVGDIKNNPIFSIIDGIVSMTQREESGEQQRFIQVSKMRATNHSRDQHSLVISGNGIDVYAPRVTIKRDPKADARTGPTGRLKTGVQALDSLIEEGIPRGSTVLVSGTAGTGKTLLSLEFVYRGAKQFNEKGIIFTFEETEERILAAASRMGWDLAAEIKRGMLEIVSIPQPDILVERHLLMMHDRISQLQAKRIVLDSASVFLHKVDRSQMAREKIYQLATIVQSAHAVGFCVTDVPYGTNGISRFGVEETVVDGIILLTSVKEGLKRERFLEVYKLRNAIHASGKYKMELLEGGIKVQAK